ncbi:hypothetical protein EYC84_001653 [Monilinia fructicola]|uniref:Uncharacterized protein n=1 Tax=Monilinia fructicola TaxID=38448 RepID=A0A5M9JQ91_MONFR|nr:hypothetical protein EYC84_001653 [Monilinia fructicola]
MMGPRPLYNPFKPSSLHITLPVPSKPLYTTCPAGCAPGPCAALNPPCACNFVLITSSGQVTTPEVKPPTAPANALNSHSALVLAILSSLVIGWEDAKSSDRGDDGVLRSCDIAGGSKSREENRRGWKAFTLLSPFFSCNLVSRCAGKDPTQHASDTTANGYRRPLTIA